MSLDLSKGSSLNLNKVEGLNLNKGMVFGLGFTGKGGRSVDLDSYVAVLDSNNKPLEFIYFGKLKGTGIKHNGDDTRGGGRDTDPNETIKVNLSKLHPQANKLIVGLFIYSGASTLSGVKSAFANLTDDQGKEVCRYNLKEKFGKSSSVEVAHVTKTNGEWNFTAVGAGSSDSYQAIKSKFSSSRSYTSSSSNSNSSNSNQGFLGKMLGKIFG